MVLAVLTAASYAALFGDRWGGQPRVVVPIRTEAVASSSPPSSPAPSEPKKPADPALRDRLDVEVTSGVSVTRPPGLPGSGPAIIRVPDRTTIQLAAAPDERLSERSRTGLLPRIGPDGARAASVYARPAGSLPGGAAPAARIAVLVGGLGLNAAITEGAVARLPEAVTLAFAPYGSDLEATTRRAREAGHEIMLQMPMEPLDYPATDPGPQTLTTAAKPSENLERLRWAMGRFSGFVGISNFLGGKLTGDEAALAPILREIGARGLVFVDDGSSSRSLVGAVAEQVQTGTARADVVIDPVRSADLIDRSLEKLETLAREKGFALGSASGLPLSVERIALWAQTLEAKGILLVPVSAAFAPRGRR